MTDKLLISGKSRKSNRCSLCKGTGLIKTYIIVCKHCDAKGCCWCSGFRFTRQPWIECELCYGSGTLVEIKKLNSN